MLVRGLQTDEGRVVGLGMGVCWFEEMYNIGEVITARWFNFMVVEWWFFLLGKVLDLEREGVVAHRIFAPPMIDKLH